MEWAQAEPLAVAIDPGHYGKRLAHAGCSEQAAVINAMAAELGITCHGDHGKIERQTCYISDALDAHGEAFVMVLAEFVTLRRESLEGKVHA